MKMIPLYQMSIALSSYMAVYTLMTWFDDESGLFFGSTTKHYILNGLLRALLSSIDNTLNPCDMIYSLVTLGQYFVSSVLLQYVIMHEEA